MNCRYSDCQFSSSALPKLEEVRYRPSEMVVSWCAVAWSLKSCQPANAWPDTAATKKAKKTSERLFSRRKRRINGA